MEMCIKGNISQAALHKQKEDFEKLRNFLIERLSECRFIPLYSKGIFFPLRTLTNSGFPLIFSIQVSLAVECSEWGGGGAAGNWKR